MKLAIEKRVPVVSRKSTYRNVTSAIHSSPEVKPVKEMAIPVAFSVGRSTTFLKYCSRSCPPAHRPWNILRHEEGVHVCMAGEVHPCSKNDNRLVQKLGK